MGTGQAGSTTGNISAAHRISALTRTSFEEPYRCSGGNSLQGLRSMADLPDTELKEGEPGYLTILSGRLSLESAENLSLGSALDFVASDAASGGEIEPASVESTAVVPSSRGASPPPPPAPAGNPDDDLLQNVPLLLKDASYVRGYIKGKSPLEFHVFFHADELCLHCVAEKEKYTQISRAYLWPNL